MLDQLIIGSKASLDDFGASLAERAISTPKKKEIKETVPFSNLTYDFSKINGELYWEVSATNHVATGETEPVALSLFFQFLTIHSKKDSKGGFIYGSNLCQKQNNT